MKSFILVALFYASLSHAYLTPPGGGGGGGGAVDSVNGKTGVVVLDFTDFSAAWPLSAPNGAVGAPSYLFQDNDSGLWSEGDGNVSISANGFQRLEVNQNDVHVLGPLNVDGDIAANNYPPTGSNNTLAGFNSSGDLYTVPGHTINAFGGINLDLAQTFDDRTGGQTVVNSYFPFRPLQDSPDESWNVLNSMIEIDPDSDGFTMGTSGQAFNWHNIYIKHFGTSDTGQIKFFNLGSDIGNGTDAIDVAGVQTASGFWTIADNVTVSNQIQGYGHTVNVADGAVINQFSQAFFDNSNYAVEASGYQSFSASPIIAGIKNNNGYTGLNVNPAIANFTGNAGFTGISAGGDLGTFDTGSYQGLLVNPTIDDVDNAQGISVSMDNVTATNKLAAYLDGDVEITGSLTFGGALSIGNLNAFGTLDPVVDGGGNPTSVNLLVSSINIPDNATTANADTIGLNSAMLLTVGDNSNITLGAFGLFTSLALPTVVETHTGSNLPAVQGGVFALNFSGSSTGGTVEEASAGRFVLIPNGITTIDRAIGVKIDQPFGAVGTENFGIYQEDAASNFFEGDLQTQGGVQLKTSATQPTCDASKRGLLWNVEGGTGVADSLEVCQKDAADAYGWVSL